MTDVSFTLLQEPPSIGEPHPHPALAASGHTVQRDGVNQLFTEHGPFAVVSRSRVGAAWVVTLSADLLAGQKTALKAALEATGYCAGVAFP